MKRVGLDTNIFMGIFLEEREKLESSLKILRFIAEGSMEGVVSCISLIEMATLFYQKNEGQKGRKAVNIIREIPNTTIIDITADMATSIAEIKVSERLSIADATILTSVLALKSDAFLTYDHDFAKVTKIKCLKPDDYLEVLKAEGLGI